ncbi:coiled-coil domain-containing protein 97 [Microplitis mediator]|uniref:coiled-coil domain-containing protein 97 n=1 Tax=Microplitis mediator TaxID=375433 RepID=UPI002557130B|nr:coiled-coil domain-containing protein 97 [Microplitis mediator]XP_057325327.1 coiled-coil domain-containing protein 97 [Microplitis mediator]
MDQLLGEEINKPIVHVNDDNNDNDDDNEQKNNDIGKLSHVENEIINSVAKSSAVFKCQHKDEPELSVDEKKKIAWDLLSKSPVQFLSRFGRYLNNELLKYFETADDKSDYEIAHYINKLKRYFDSTSREIDKKNRRYEALKLLVDKGEYFSETAMMKRNPLLYDNLVGQYLTDEQKRERDSAGTDDHTLVDVLMQGIERDQVERLMQRQEDDENDVMEENDSDSDSESDDCKNKLKLKSKPVLKNNLRWGELPDGKLRSKSAIVNTYDDSDESITEKNNLSLGNNKLKGKNIKTKEINILRQEFVTHMYQNFLNGHDKEFDYSTIDDNEAYDNVELRTQDEEEKYFDSESPELINSPSVQQSQDDSEDELDKYMNSLKEQTNITQDPP